MKRLHRPWAVVSAIGGLAIASLLVANTASGQRAEDRISPWAQGPSQRSAVPTPRIYCDTPTPGPSPTSAPFWPELIVRGMAVDHVPCAVCGPPGDYWGVVVDVGNAGMVTGSWAFQVEVNGVRKAVSSLHQGKFVNVFFPGLPGGDTTVVVDPDNESGEHPEATFRGNNVLRGILPTPPTMHEPAMCTPVPGDIPRPDLSVERLSISLRPWWECGDPPEHGVYAEVVNRGTGAAGAFVVSINGTPRACDALGADTRCTVFATGYRQDGPQGASADSSGQVAESDETNNTLREMVPIPTLPPCTSATPSGLPTDEGTSTVTPAATETPAAPTMRWYLPALSRS